ncbi:MAG: putative nucleotide-diphospho-sugar transferase [Patescibacteria group bacterium]
MKAIVTICNELYNPLLKLWLERICAHTKLPVYVLSIGHIKTLKNLPCNYILINKKGNPFPPDRPDHACAEKLRIFNHLPKNIKEVLFIDIDVMVLFNFWTTNKYFEKSHKYFIATQDFFVGYKEKMEDEFKPFNPKFIMKYLPDKSYFYFNTGVFFASRKLHENFFKICLNDWKKYVKSQKKYPSIFDQNIFNYCLITHAIKVKPMPIKNNCLRQYNPMVKNNQLWLGKKKVYAMHFNGGDIQKKLRRWKELKNELEIKKYA